MALTNCTSLREIHGRYEGEENIRKCVSAFVCLSMFHMFVIHELKVCNENEIEIILNV